jgi:hypothetical protein
MLRSFAIERRGFSVSRHEVRWAIATLRDLNGTTIDRSDPTVSYLLTFYVYKS